MSLLADRAVSVVAELCTTVQMAKVGRALVAEDTGAQVEELAADGATAPEGSAAADNAAVTGGSGGQQAVKPQFFKALAGKGHQEFSSGRQQVSGQAVRPATSEHLVPLAPEQLVMC